MFIPCIRAITEMRVVVARMIPSSVRKLRSLFLLRESTAIRAASQNEALGRYLRCFDTDSSGRRKRLGLCSRNSIRRRRQSSNPVQHEGIQPEPWFSPRKEPKMTAVFRSNQSDVRVRYESRMRVNLEWNQRVVFGRNHQCRNLNGTEVSSRRLRRVIVRRRSKTEERSRESIIEFPNGSYLIEAVGAVEVRP